MRKKETLGSREETSVWSLSPVIGLDTSVYLAARDGEKKAVNLFEAIKRQRPNVYVSVLVILESSVRIFRDGREDRLAEFLEFLGGRGLITFVDLNQLIALIAARLRARHRVLKTPDAIHLATALEKGAVEFFSADKRLPKRVEGLKVVYV